jgi:hypothetical protein
VKKLDSLLIPSKPALLFEEENRGLTLVIADLHLGYTYNRISGGIQIPQHARPENEVFQLVDEYTPQQIIFLGDFKDEVFGARKGFLRRMGVFLNKLLIKSEVMIIKGNHDGKIEDFVPEQVEVISSKGICLEEKGNQNKIGLWHGHAYPALDVMNAEITISGHAHPVYHFRELTGAKIVEKVWVKKKWSSEETRKKKRIHLIMPAFNNYITGFPVDEKIFSEFVIVSEAIDFSKAEVFTLEGILLGTIEELIKNKAEFDRKRISETEKQVKFWYKRKK